MLLGHLHLRLLYRLNPLPAILSDDRGENPPKPSDVPTAAAMPSPRLAASRNLPGQGLVRRGHARHGISFSEQNRTFIQRIDSQIDREQTLELVDRPTIPQHGQNATGDNVETDAKIAVLILK